VTTAATTAVRTRGGVRRVPDNRQPGPRQLPTPLGRVIGDAERAGRAELSAVSGDDLLKLWESAVGQVQGLVPVLAHTVDELARHVRDKRTAEPLFTQANDPGPDDSKGH
jgi:hypothetical protein